jgi:hypothetical protein
MKLVGKIGNFYFPVQDMLDFACLFNTDCGLNIDSLFEFRSMYLTVN